MRNLLKKAGQIFFNILLIILFVGPGITAFSAPGKQIQVAKACTGMNVVVSGQSSGSVSFAWTPVAGAGSYTIHYVRKENNQSTELNQTGTSLNLSSLPAGNYTFSFSATGDNGYTESTIIIDIWI